MRFLLPLLFSFPVFAALPEHIQVQGKCDVKVTPDRGTVIFMAENQSKDQKQAVSKTTQQIDALKEKIQKLKLPDLELKNGQYNVFPVREYDKERVVNKGIRASLSLEVTTSEIARLGEAISAASEVGITNAGSMNVFLSLEKSQSEYLKCLEIAADDAKNKAKKLAKKLGFEIGEVVNLIETPQVSDQPIPHSMSMMKATMAETVESTKVEAGSISFSTIIQVSFRIK